VELAVTPVVPFKSVAPEETGAMVDYPPAMAEPSIYWPLLRYKPLRKPQLWVGQEEPAAPQVKAEAV
jgi:hypothetical protein